MTHASSDDGSPASVTVGVLADPVAAPAQVGQQLAADLPSLLSDQLADECDWRVELQRTQLPASNAHSTTMIDIAEDRMRRNEWDLAVCVTDSPLRSGRQPLVADMSSDRGVIVVSLPALGGMALRRRVRGVVAQLIVDMRSVGTPPERSAEYRRRRLPWLANRFRRVTPEQPDVDVRILASRGGPRLLVGMVRDNRPWRLVFSLTGPLVGAFAFSAFYLVSTVVWRLAATMEPWQLVGAVLGSIVLMVGWLTGYHHLWEPVRKRPVFERDQAVLFNISTVASLFIGVGTMYAGLYAANLAAAGILLTPEVFGPYTGGDLGIGDYAVVMLVVTAAATVAGAIGSGFESEDAIREAAFSYRERERRQALRQLQAEREHRAHHDQ